MSNPIFQDWGLIDYESALKQQLELVEIVSQDHDHPGFFIFCTHPEVVTTGRQTQSDDVFDWNGPLVEISRGGRATYHGPSQLVVYPILNLKKERHGRSPQEIRGYIRTFENCIIKVLKEYGIPGLAKAPDTGVWVGDLKVASIGIAVKKWICYHGAAINLDEDKAAFQGLNPCGFKSAVMTCIQSLTGNRVDRAEFSQRLLKILNMEL